MKELVERIQNEGIYLGKGIIKADGFINHQLDPELTMNMGIEFKKAFTEAGVENITRIVTAEVSGIAPALAASVAYGVPMVFARKKKPSTMTDELLSVDAPSRTKGGIVSLYISSEYLKSDDRVLLIDDFLATGNTVEAMANLIKSSGAELCGIGCVVEKAFEKGRELLADIKVPVVTLAKVDVVDDGLKVY